VWYPFSLNLLCSFQGPPRTNDSGPGLGPLRGLSKLNSMQAPAKSLERRHVNAPLVEGARSGRHLVTRCGQHSRAVLLRRATTGAPILELPRKEVIQPHLPVRLPCYDFTPVTGPTFDGSLPKGLGHRLRVLPTSVV
jgi:hypothetical protein